MTNLPLDNNETRKPLLEFFKSLWKFIQKLLGLDNTQKKCACGSKCGSNCFCDGCLCTIAYDEKESDNDDPDIYMTQDSILVT